MSKDKDAILEISIHLYPIQYTSLYVISPLWHLTRLCSARTNAESIRPKSSKVKTFFLPSVMD